MNITIKINPVHLAAARFQDADDAWGKELIRLFRREACNARYEKRGRGEAGSVLRQLHDVREAARVKWEVRTGLKADTV